MKSTGTIDDFVGVRRHPTVVRLDSLDAADAEWVTGAYHRTAEVEKHLTAVRRMLESPSGTGAFLIGQYGSGKSHFLAYLTQSLRAGKFLRDAPAVVPLSLLNFRAEVPLEDIVCGALGIPAGHGDRRRAWAELRTREPRGTLLLIDELSEFLRSKGDQRQFNEDIRFLQFLGEWASQDRFWVLAAVQEQIEHTGELEYDLYRKIKDRFPLRLILSTTHVRDLVRDVVLVKKPGYEEAVETLVRRIREALPNAPLDYDALRAVYPIHPATLDLLEEVRDSFSQARGVIDFCVGSLAGRREKGIPPFLARPWGTLLGPEAIVDHFEDLFEVQPEFLPLSQRYLPYYRKQLAVLFDAPAQRELAGRLVKLLLLAYLSPARRGLTAADASYWLLYHVSRIDPEQNVRAVERTLEVLATRGRFITQKDGFVRIDLEDDGWAAVEREIEREKDDLREKGDIVFDVVTPLLAAEEFGPLGVPAIGWQSRSVRWHFHERQFALCLSNDEALPPHRNAAASFSLCVRMPWGRPTAAPGSFTLLPPPLTPGEETIELAALVRMRTRPVRPDARERLDARVVERLSLLRGQVRNAFLDATLVSPAGAPEPAPRPTSAAGWTLGGWIERVAVRVLERTYPSFERHAPTYGPLPAESLRRFMEFASQHDLGGQDADEFVKVIREAYLVPMGLLERRQGRYVVKPNLERAELVRLVTDVADTQPPPKVLYEHCGAPVFGLVPDQVSVLLVFLLIQGEIDILKDGRSYREIYTTLPSPLHYDKVVPGRALPLEQLRALEEIASGVGLRAPKQWSALAQRHAVRGLRQAIAERADEARSLCLKLGRFGGRDAERVARVVETAQRFLDVAASLDTSGDELAAFQAFLAAAGSASRFLALHSATRELPARIDRFVNEVGRFQHLLTHPIVAGWPNVALAQRRAEVGEAPGLDAPEALEAWLGRARAAHEDFKRGYAQAHEAFWKEQALRSIWSWSPPRVASSRHLGLEAELRALRSAREKAERLLCRGLTSLDFQPQCTCGFDGTTSPVAGEIDSFEVLRREVTARIGAFFADPSVRERYRGLVEAGLEPAAAAAAYLEGREPAPQTADLEILDRHLAGIDAVKDLDETAIFGALADRVWTKDGVLAAVAKLLATSGGSRFRVRRGSTLGGEAIALWCLEHCLRSGSPLPAGLAESAVSAAAPGVRPEWISAGAIARLEELGLGETALATVLRKAMDPVVTLPRGTDSPPLAAALGQLREASDPGTGAELGRLAAVLYSSHHVFLGVDRVRWLERLERLAQTQLREPVLELVDILRERPGAAWVVVDGLGLALLDTLLSNIGELLPGYTVESVACARVSTRTTTDGWYRELIAAGIEAGGGRPVRKINAIDSLLHSRSVPFRELARLAAAELHAAFHNLRGELRRDRRLVLFADHGFRIAATGTGFVHGGASTLERIVPVVGLSTV